MDTSVLKKYAQTARRNLQEQVSAKLKVVLAPDSLARRESSSTVTRLEEAIKDHSQDYIIDKISYIWFNRFSALRFMDVNHYTSIGIVSPVEGQSQPEILAEAKMGHVDPEIVPAVVRQRVNDLINGQIPSKNPQLEAYRFLIVAACNYWNQAMPFLFEKINDYTELLMPDDLLSEQSTLTRMQTVMSPESCADVEIIGWLYQFYISEKKDEVFEGLKKNKKITPENIPAATQLFTPHWIVRYLVENSLGRLWMLNHPNSSLITQMDYYIKPEQPENDFLKIRNPEEIKICDPACGSGHMLVYAFDLLYAIYEEEGYDASEIPTKILKNNLFGVEIDERAGELAAFALSMKARSRQRGFFQQKVQPNICVLENVKFDSHELKEYMAFIGHDLFTMQLQNTLYQFEEADNFGSLIRPELTDVETMLKFLNAKNISGNLFLYQTHQKVLKVLEQADYLSSNYHIIVANPPYMGGSGMNGRLSSWVKDNYPDSKSDLFAVFIERNLSLVRDSGMVSMITMQSWMFLSTFERLRLFIMGSGTILSMAHLGTRAFDSIGGEVVSTTAFVIRNHHNSKYKGYYLRLIDGQNESNKDIMLKTAIKDPVCGWFFRASADDYKKIPGSPMAYWVDDLIRQLFDKHNKISDCAEIKNGITTSDNDKYLRYWHEVNYKSINRSANNRNDAKESNSKWYPINKGGPYRKWFGNCDYILDWENDGAELFSLRPKATIRNPNFFFKESISWSDVVTGPLSFRSYPAGFCFDASANSVFSNDASTMARIILLANNCFTYHLAPILNPTMHFKIGDFGKLPAVFRIDPDAENDLVEMTNISKNDWNEYETSYDFEAYILLQNKINNHPISKIYRLLRDYWNSNINITRLLEVKNNSIFIELYGLQDELIPEVPLSEITLTCNPYYRYDAKKPEVELESLLLADTMREFISYSVGCMFGRYSIDKPGLILANQGDTSTEYLNQISSPKFLPDEDNVIPILDGDWFADDIVERFRTFLQVTFDKEHYQENLQFIEGAIGKDIRSFFLKDFYNDHIKRYKKRPIYWLFSSPKGTFNALIYMHRYCSDTVSIILNKYLREFKVKLSSRSEYLNRVEVSTNASKAEKAGALKEREALKKNIEELDVWERDVIYPLALEQKEIDLDDGVKVNYPKFGAALKKIPGLDAEED